VKTDSNQASESIKPAGSFQAQVNSQRAMQS